MKIKTHEHVHADCAKCPSQAKGFMCSSSALVSKRVSAVKVDGFFRAGENLFRAGELPVGVFSVRRGVIKLEALTENGGAHTLRVAGPGDLVGYGPVLTGQIHAASAVALEDSDVCFLPGRAVVSLMAESPELSLKMMGRLAEDLGQAENKWVNQIDKGAAARVADALLFLNEKFGDSSWTRKEIAEWAGTTTETVIRSLAQFEKEGIISQNYRNFTILSAPRLKERAVS